MSIEHGFESPVWMSKAIVTQANPILLKKAVVEVIDHLERAHEEGSSPFEIIDRLVQVSSTGKYIPPESREETTVATLRVNDDGSLSPEDEKTLRDFGVQLDDVLGFVREDGEDEDDDEE